MMQRDEGLELVPPNEELLELTIQVANLVGQLVELLRTLATPQWIFNPSMESSTGTMPAETDIKYCPCGYGPLEDGEEMCTAGEAIQQGDYKITTVNEEKRPLAQVQVDAVSLNNWPDVSDTKTTGENGTAIFAGLVGPHYFVPRVRRIGGSVGDRSFTGDVEVQVVSMGTGPLWDYVVDADGMGTHLTLAGALDRQGEFSLADKVRDVIDTSR